MAQQNNKTQGDGPKTGDSYSSVLNSPNVYKKDGEEFSEDNDFRKVRGPGLNVKSDGPGTAKATTDKMSLQWLGDLEFGSIDETPKASQGEGDKFVVLFDYVAGANGMGFTKGQVRSASELFNGFGDRNRIEEARSNAKRYIEIGAVRLADSEEAKLDLVDLDMKKETPEFSEERSRRIQLERENEELKRKMEEMTLAAQIGQKNATPNSVSESQPGEGQKFQ